ncbi:MAG: DUF3108 domain-containing protein [Planctomycetota bacterium]
MPLVATAVCTIPLALPCESQRVVPQFVSAHEELAGAAQVPAPLVDPAVPSDAPIADEVRFDSGGTLPLVLPRDERLEFAVILELGALGDIHAGDVELAANVERYVAGLPAAGSQPAPAKDAVMGRVRSTATGGYAGYTLHHELISRVLPQTWPRVFYTDTQSGSEHRRRELKIGVRDDESRAWYRADGHCKGCNNPEHFIESKWLWGKPFHCEKCKRPEHRVWRDLQTRTVPSDAVDMLSAVYLTRALMREKRESAQFHLIDRQKLWVVQLKRGNTSRIATPAGAFLAQEVVLSTKFPAGEPRDAGFEGLFGIRGSLRVWVDAESGVPILIRGEFPVPVLGALDVRVELTSYRGTPDAFRKVK